jgi:hypothetical protein
LDAQRELDHHDVLKAFRSGATIASVILRISLIDTLNEVHKLTIRNLSAYNESKQEEFSLNTIAKLKFNM